MKKRLLPAFPCPEQNIVYALRRSLFVLTAIGVVTASSPVMAFVHVTGLSRSADHVQAQDRIVTGVVTDDKGNVLPGVNVLVKGTSIGVATEVDGSFRLAVPDDGAVLVFSFIGFRTVSVAANSGPHTIRLESDASTLNEVVVVGYGTQKKGDIVGAVGTLDAKNIDELPIARVEQALIGQIAGVQVRQQTGMPGAGLSIVVRGSGSITAGSEPLYVIDGFPLDISGMNGNGSFSTNPLSSLNPNDIESIQVLKDAAAGAIYGSRAANGVVIITTKKGKAGRVKINVSANTGISQVSKKLDVLSPEEWMAMATEVANNNWVRGGAGRTASQTNDERRAILGLAPDAYNLSVMPDERWTQPGHPGLALVDWQEELFRRALFQNYEVSGSGGSEGVKYFISGNYLNQEGALIKSDYKNYGLRANVEAKVGKRFTFGINLAPTYSITNAPEAEGKDNQLMKAAQMVPIAESTAGVLTGAGEYPTYRWSSARLISPVAFINTSINRTKSSRLLSTVYGELSILPGLSLRSAINYDDINQDNKRYISDYAAVGAATERITNPGKLSSGSYRGYKKQNFLNETTLNFTTTLAERHAIAAVAGISYNIVHSESFLISTEGGFANNIVNTLNNAIANTAGITVSGNTAESNNTLFSYYGRVQYAYHDRYLLSASFRRDASSKFGKENRWGSFPSLSAGWRISEEAFMKSLTFIDDLKLRFSWGKSGNNNIGDYNAVSALTKATYSFGGNTPVAASGQVVAGLANPYLKWETSDTYNAGIDIGVLGGRISLSADVYYKKNRDLLLNLPVLAASGYSSSLQNIGAVVNRGLELNAKAHVLSVSGFTWITSGNIAFNANKVTALAEGDATIYVPSNYTGNNPPFLLQKGLPIYSFYVTRKIGLLTDEDIANPNVAKLPKQVAGDPKYLDANPDGIIDAQDRVVYGRPTPKYTWGITNTFQYKNFDLSVHVYGQHGGALLSFLGRAVDFSGSTTANVLGVWRDHWTPENPNPNASRGRLGASYTVPHVTSEWIYSSDFWRVQNITLGYNLKHLIPNAAITQARIYASLQNWFNHDKYTGGVNPEAQNTDFSGDASYGVPGDYGAMPLSKTMSVGVNISF